MPDTSSGGAVGGGGKQGRSSGWYVFLLAWLVFAGAFYVLSKKVVTDAPDITNGELLDLAHRYASFVGIALGLIAFIVTGIVYLVLRLFRLKALRLAALFVTALGYSVWLVFGYDLVYREPRYAEVARAIITYLGKPMLYSATVVVGGAVLGILLSLVFGRKKS